jgi:hypothetical protein
MRGPLTNSVCDSYQHLFCNKIKNLEAFKCYKWKEPTNIKVYLISCELWNISKWYLEKNIACEWEFMSVGYYTLVTILLFDAFHGLFSIFRNTRQSSSYHKKQP